MLQEFETDSAFSRAHPLMHIARGSLKPNDTQRTYLSAFRMRIQYTLSCLLVILCARHTADRLEFRKVQSHRVWRARRHPRGESFPGLKMADRS